MGVAQLRIRLSEWGLLGPTAWLPLLIALVWTAAAVRLSLLQPAGPKTQLALLVVPAVLITAAIIKRRGDVRTLAVAAAWTATVGAALVLAPRIAANSEIALAVPALALSGWLCGRYPAIGVTAIVALTGTYGTLQIYLSLPVGSLIDVLLIGLMAGALWHGRVGRRNERLYIWPSIALLMLYIGVTVIAIPLSPAGATLAAKSFHNSAFYMLALPLIAFAPWSHETRMRIASGVVLVALAIGAYACLRLAVGPTAQEKAYLLGLPQTQPDNLGLFGSFLSHKELGAWFSLVVPFCFGFALFARGTWRLLSLLAFALGAVALFASDAREPAAVAIGGTLLCLLLLQLTRAVPGLHLGRSAVFAGILVIGAVAAYLIASPNDASRPYSSIFHPGRDLTFQYREDTWSRVLAEVPKKPLGHGLGTGGQVAALSGRYRNAASGDLDNSYLLIAYQQGFAVMVLFTASLVLILIGLARRAVFTRRRDAAWLAICASGVLIAFAAESYGTGIIEFFPALLAWTLIGIGIAEFTRIPASDEPSA